jgi:CheY-like chemotaxis protein
VNTQKVPAVLVVDDDPDLRESVQDLLEENGYQVHTAANGREALEALERLPGVCILLLDWMMPVMSGEEFLEQLRQWPEAKRPAVLIVSASGAVRAEGVAGTLKKPFSIDDLLALVGTHCGGGVGSTRRRSAE